LAELSSSFRLKSPVNMTLWEQCLQIEGRSATPSWDLGALAVMAYEITVGIYPFGETESTAALHGAILRGKFAPVERPAWQAFFGQTFNPVVARRPASAIGFLTAFERALAQR
jgi:hypothetical protein